MIIIRCDVFYWSFRAVTIVWGVVVFTQFAEYSNRLHIK